MPHPDACESHLWRPTVPRPTKSLGHSMSRTKHTPGQKLWLGLYRADLYDKQAATVSVPPGAPKLNPERGTKHWLEGMSRDLKERFPTELRTLREELGLSQQEL